MKARWLIIPATVLLITGAGQGLTLHTTKTPAAEAIVTEALPGQAIDTWQAVLWFSGMAARPGIPPDNGHGNVYLYQLHDLIVREWPVSQLPLPADPEQHSAWATAAAASQRLATASLRDVRQTMRGRGLLLPDLPATLAWIDEDDADGSR